jgi:hypothetical protein
MTISLLDISTATATYLETEVQVRIGQVTSNLQPDEDGTYTVRVTNAAAPTGVRLTELTLHLTVSPRSVALLRPPTGLLVNARRTADENDPLLGNDDLVDEMFVFFIGPGAGEEFDGILDVGEVMEQEFRYRAEGRGDATIRCHVHASVDLDDLFPRSAGPNGEQTLTVIRG